MDLLNEIEDITKNVIEPEKEKETREDIKIKLNKFKTIITKKDMVRKEMNTQMTTLKLSVEAAKHDAVLREQILYKQTKQLENMYKEGETKTKENYKLVKENDGYKNEV